MVGLLIGAGILTGMATDFGPLTSAGASLAVLAALVSPAVGLVTLVFTMSLQPPAVLSPIGFHAVLVVAILLGCVFRLHIERPTLRLGAPAFLLLAWLLLVIVQLLPYVVFGDPNHQFEFVAAEFKQVLIGVGAVIAVGLVLTQRRPFPFLVAGLASAAVAAILAITAFAGIIAGSPLSHLIAQSDLGSRASGPFGNANYFGFFEAMAITAAAGLAAWARSGTARSLLFATCGVLGIALALSLSRGAVITVAAGLVALVFVRRRVLGVALFGFAVIAVVVLYPAFQELRLGLTFGSAGADAYIASDVSDASRAEAGLAGLQLFASSPLFGVGFGLYHFLTEAIVATQAVTYSHNWYVNVLAEQGALGAVLWVLLLLATVAKLRSRPPFPGSIGLAVLVAYVVGSFFAEPPTSFQSSGFAMLVIVAALAGDWDYSAMGRTGQCRSEPERDAPADG